MNAPSSPPRPPRAGCPSRGAPRLGLLALLLATAGCGLLNSVGTHHPLYEENVAFCHHCTRSGQVCSAFGEKGTCVATDTLSECPAAEGFFSTQEEEGPFVFPVTGKGLDFEAKHPCPDGRVPAALYVAALDREDDVSFGVDYDMGEAIFDLSEDVQLIDEEGRGARPVAWQTEVFTSSTSDIVYSLTLRFCLLEEPSDPVAVQLLDERGHTSNRLCVAP